MIKKAFVFRVLRCLLCFLCCFGVSGLAAQNVPSSEDTNTSTSTTTTKGTKKKSKHKKAKRKSRSKSKLMAKNKSKLKSPSKIKKSQEKSLTKKNNTKNNTKKLKEKSTSKINSISNSNTDMTDKIVQGKSETKTSDSKSKYQKQMDPRSALYDPRPEKKHSTRAMNYPEMKRYIHSRMQSETHSMLQSKIQELDIPDWLTRTELDYDYWSFGKSKGYSVLTVQPLYLSDCNVDTLFFQGRINRQTRFGESLWRTTYNVGVGYRKLLWDDSVMLGANAFYDYEAPHKHRRSSLGLELRTTAGEINTNIYFPDSKTIWVSNNTFERALRGWNIEVGVPLPYTPWIKVYASKYRWDNILFAKTDGHRFSVEVTPVPFVRFEGGAFKDNVTTKYKYFIKGELSFGFLGPDNYDHSGVFNQDPYIFCPMNERTLDKVRRVDTIVVERATVSSTQNPVTGLFTVIIRRLG